MKLSLILILISFSHLIGAPRQTKIEDIFKKYTSSYIKSHSKEHRMKSFNPKDYKLNDGLYIVVRLENVPIFSKPELNHKLIITFASEKEVFVYRDETWINAKEPKEIKNQIADWIEVEMFDGRTGWILAGAQNTDASLKGRFPFSKVNPKINTYFIFGIVTYCMIVLVLIVVSIFIVVRYLTNNSYKKPIYSQSRIDSNRDLQNSFSPTNYYDSYSDYDTCLDNDNLSKYDTTSNHSGNDEKPNWAWKDEKIILSKSNVKKRGFIGDTKVGKVEKDFWGDEIIYKEGLIFDKEVGKIVRHSFSDDEVVDKKGKRIGKIKSKFIGPDKIVDDDGNEICDYEDD